MTGTVLIVDDEQFARDTMRKMIEKNHTGWTIVAEAENGEEAIVGIEEWEPDLVITDVRMPLMDGLELAEWIRRHRERMKVVILTGYRDFEYAQAALRSGVVEFLLKPCSEREVNAVLTKIYGQLCEEEHAIRTRQRLEEDTAIRALFYRLPCDMQVVKRMKSGLQGTRLYLIHVLSFWPVDKNYEQQDLPILQFTIGNIVQELAEEWFHSARVVLLDNDRLALFVDKCVSETALQDEVFVSTVAEQVREWLAIPIVLHAVGVVEQLEQLPVFHFDPLERGEDAGSWLDRVEASFLGIIEQRDARKQDSVITQALHYIEQHYMEHCSLNVVASSVFLHPNYFSALFKREMGMGFSQYLTQFRLERAEWMLSHTDARVADIARDVGYDDPNYFSTLFRKKYAVSPNEYRKQ